MPSPSLRESSPYWEDYMVTSKKTYQCDEVETAWLLLEQTRNAIFKARELELEQHGLSICRGAGPGLRRSPGGS